MKKNKVRRCSICGRKIKGEMNVATPINYGVCCDKCNDTVVIPARVRLANKKEQEKLSPEETKSMLKVKNLKRGRKKY